MSPPPDHVAIIMDGNGRWAAARAQSRAQGHRHGADAVRAVITRARELGIPTLSLFAFSAQNWARPASEVAHLMLLLARFCRRERELLHRERVRVVTLGRLDRLPLAARRALQEVVRQTARHTGMTLVLAIDYGGREEIESAVQRAWAEGHAAGMHHAALAGHRVPAPPPVASFLSSGALPPVDLLIRTGGEHRLSNYMLWQLAYAELIFCDTPWPAFQAADLDQALAEFHQRARRFGALPANDAPPARAAAR